LFLRNNVTNNFIQQGCIKLIKSDSKDMYNMSNEYYFELSID